jgi:hypothetical protein
LSEAGQEIRWPLSIPKPVTQVTPGSITLIIRVNNIVKVILSSRWDNAVRRYIINVLLNDLGFLAISNNSKLLDEVIHDFQLKEVVNISLYCLSEMIHFYKPWGVQNDVDGIKLMRRYNL